MTKRRRASKRTGNRIWTAVTLGTVVLSSVHDGVSIVNEADWSSAPNEKATLLAIRGWIHLTSIAGANARATLLMGKFDADELASAASTDPDNVATYVNEDILWTGGMTSSGGGIDHVNMQINVKAKRKMRATEDINLIYACSPTDNFIMGGVLRALLLVS